MASVCKLKFDTAEAGSFLAELQELAERRKSLPEFVQRLREIADLLPDGFEAVWVGLDGGTTSAGDFHFALKVRDPLLVRLATLRAFDRDFDLSLQVHGHSFRGGV